MITDALNLFADAVALNTGAAGDYVIGDQIDLQIANSGIGALVGSAAMYLVIVVDTAATSGGAATGQFSLLTDDDSALGSPVVVATSAAFAKTAMTAGAVMAVFALPPGYPWLRYIGIRQTTGTAAFTAGKINAFLTQTPPARFAYPQDALVSAQY